MTGPAWLAAPVAAIMLLIAATCAARLVISRSRGRPVETDADGVHVLMGVAMAGMLEPRLGLVPGVAWQAMFGAAAAWFGWQAIRVRRRRPGGWRCAHPAPHAVECAAMVYMLVPAGRAGHTPAMAMPGMSSSAAAGSNPAVALVLAMFILGYILWTTDRIAAHSRGISAAPSNSGRGPSLAPTAPAPATSGPPTAGLRALEPAGGAAAALLAPRFAACYKIAMSVAMGYMLIAMI